ncbi:SusC/RagA family TonB-linked outer membrane protein [Parapedobacter sp. 2B3]|uniref:SusC/RagA family TonB-linked outer membrane protein n=1 Tax=Parapedobacter sp. 2B3 TaxID=3342381 RepID=UPI0035B68B8E
MKLILRIGEGYALSKIYSSLLAVAMIMCLYARAQRPDTSGPVLSGIVVDTAGVAIPGATVAIKGTSLKSLTNDNGRFTLRASGLSGTLVVSYLGHQTVREKFDAEQGREFQFVLVPTENMLEEVEVSTGYQTIPKERATGSFDHISSSKFNHRTSANIIARIEGLTPGTNYLDRSGAIVNHGASTVILVRGQAGFTANSRPLIVLDNFPYEGDINNINPNDVQDITILKDAAAASIWGARAGGGVIVITTKKARYGRPMGISVTAGISAAAKPDLYYRPMMDAGAFIEFEQFLFQNGYYNSRLTNTRTYPYVSPVVELLDSHRSGDIGDEELEAQLDFYRTRDIRADYLNHIYRPETKQQYGISISGGSERMSVTLAAGYNKDIHHKVTSGYQRINTRVAVNVKPINRLEVAGSVLLTNSQRRDIGTGSNITYEHTAPFLPTYLSLFTEDGELANVGRSFRPSYVQAEQQRGIYLYRGFNPIEEIGESELRIGANDLTANIGVKYNFLPNLSAAIHYQYDYNNTEMDDIMGENSFFMREMINRFTVPDEDGIPIHYLPVGDRLGATREKRRNNQWRGQLNYGFERGDHAVSALAAVESRDNYTFSHYDLYYGYDRDAKTRAVVDVVNPQPTERGTSQRIEYFNSVREEIPRYTSILANAGYSFRKKYDLTASVRKDASNQFGVRTNRRGTPFWSIGAAWTASSEEAFRHLPLSHLRLRATYGYNGNTNNSIPAIPVISRRGLGSVNLLPYATAGVPPNPSLRWEEVRTINLGVDFAILDERLSGTFEYYFKSFNDLISSAPIDPTTGYLSYNGNNADVSGRGFDLSLNSVNVKNRQFQWGSELILNYNRQEIERYYNNSLTASNLIQSSFPFVAGMDRFALFAYPFAGLDPANGDPQGYLDGEVTKDYSALLRADIEDIKYMGPSQPRYVGSFGNHFRFKDLELAIRLLYKFDYVFFRQGLSYQFLRDQNYGNPDFDKRWRVSGDELHTHVPSMVYPINIRRDQFYNQSEALVERGDFISIQEVFLAYKLPPLGGSSARIRLHATASNLGILWRANKLGIDPRIADGPGALPFPLQIAVGATLDF